MVSIRKRPGAKQRPNVTQNEHTERWNPLKALTLSPIGKIEGGE
jgi:hypothetical protein